MRSSCRFEKKKRLAIRSEFLNLFDSPNVYRGSVVLVFFKGNSKDHSRLGITVKGKISSVWRIATKRLIREWFRVNQAILGAIDINVVIKAPKRMTKTHLHRIKRDLSIWQNNLCKE